jgi:hypothetical protein
MLKPFLWRPVLATGLIGLLLAGLTLAACGSTATPAAEVPPTPTVAAATNTPVTQPTTEQKPTDAAQAPTAAPSTPPTPVKPGCTAVDPKIDQLAGAMEFLSKYIDEAKPVPVMVAIADQEWSKGPANAPLTVIEYGDFQ